MRCKEVRRLHINTHNTYTIVHTEQAKISDIHNVGYA